MTQKEWYEFVDTRGLLLASAKWESRPAAWTRVPRHNGSRKGGIQEVAQKRRLLIPVDDDADSA